MKTCRSGLHQYDLISNVSTRGCLECRKLRAKGLKRKAYEYTYVREHRERMSANSIKWRLAHPEEFKANQKAYRLAYPSRINAKNRQRVATKLSRTPRWLTDAHNIAIQAFYDSAHSLTLETGTAFEVDHIVPLKGRNVSGLHVPWNLQLLTESENCKKSNTL